MSNGEDPTYIRALGLKRCIYKDKISSTTAPSQQRRLKNAHFWQK